MTEWWQQGEDDAPVPVPRRDSVPETRFSDPGDVTSSPELTTFIPEWRAKRRVVAIIVTVAALGAIVWSTIDLFRIMSISDPVDRTQETGRFVFVFVLISLSLVAIVQVWYLANKKDPRDERKLRS